MRMEKYVSVSPGAVYVPEFRSEVGPSSAAL